MEARRIPTASSSRAVSKSSHTRSVSMASTTVELDDAPSNAIPCACSPGLKNSYKGDNGGKHRKSGVARNPSTPSDRKNWVKKKTCDGTWDGTPTPAVAKRMPRFQLSLDAALGFDTATPPVSPLPPSSPIMGRTSAKDVPTALEPCSTLCPIIPESSSGSGQYSESNKSLGRPAGAKLVKVTLGVIASPSDKKYDDQGTKRGANLRPLQAPKQNELLPRQHTRDEAQQPSLNVASIFCGSPGKNHSALVRPLPSIDAGVEEESFLHDSLSDISEPVYPHCQKWLSVPYSMAIAFASIPEAQLMAAVASVRQYHD